MTLTPEDKRKSLGRTKELLQQHLDGLTLKELEAAEMLLGHVVTHFNEAEWIQDTNLASVFDSDGHCTTKRCAVGWINLVGTDIEHFPRQVSAERVSYMAFAVNALMDEAFVERLINSGIRLNHGIIETGKSVQGEGAWLASVYNDIPGRRWNEVHEMFKNAFDSVNKRVVALREKIKDWRE